MKCILCPIYHALLKIKSEKKISWFKLNLKTEEHKDISNSVN